MVVIKLKKQISDYLTKTQYGKTLERLKKKKRPCHKDGVSSYRSSAL